MTTASSASQSTFCDVPRRMGVSGAVIEVVNFENTIGVFGGSTFCSFA